MSRSNGERKQKYENLLFWAREFTSVSQKFKEGVQKFSFLAHYFLKAEPYRYIYIVIFGKHISELYWIVFMRF